MGTGFFIATTIIFATKWLITRIGAKALVYYLQKKGYTPPTDEEMKECTRYVVMKQFNANQIEP